MSNTLHAQKNLKPASMSKQGATLDSKPAISQPRTPTIKDSSDHLGETLKNISIKDDVSGANSIKSRGVPNPVYQKADTSGKKKKALVDYNIEKTLGTGSFGRVHLVKEKESGKYYAMKALQKATIVKLKQVEHTLNEKKILEKLNHPFLVSMVASFQDTAIVYFVLEYVQGGELFSYLRKCNRFPNHVAKFYAAEVTLAFENLHSMGIVYRDLKPENILITAKGHIKITDFGFAKIVTDQTWTLCGTPDYLAPEIIQSKGYNHAVDWWALGILIYEMVAGYPPFYHEDPMHLYENVIQCKPKFSNSFDPNCKDLVKKLLVSDLSKRFGNLKGGVSDIKTHKWFAGVDWVKLGNCEIESPYVPNVRNPNDTSHFDQYDEDFEPYGTKTGRDPYEAAFKDF